ncbi:sugar ABC transporter permease [Nocardioides sp. KC13]|uniref:Sugar ABC transporter permease n=1 Tax=Nocardioides turkmenicus TaxID=2711220 RepID=A0A6M1QZZ1_9ACTN|nr:sugar ABC transporter permease [Nocardioides sp. KC13]NGN93416.1 sugar ABC transporter permease [Nocardioides sp. KC13]
MASPRVSLRTDARDGIALITPVTVVVGAVIVLPILWTVVLSFQDARYIDVARNGLLNELTLDNFTSVLTDDGFWEAMLTTVEYSVGTTLGSIVVGLVAALAFRDAFRFRAPLRAVMLLPYVAPVVATTFVWQVALNPQYGVVNAFGTEILGWERPVPFLSTAPTALLTVIAYDIWRYFPFAFIFLGAALTGLSRELEEAAVVDGATPLQKFWHVVLPQLMPTIALLALFRMVMAFNEFDDIFLLTGGAADTQVASIRVYEQLTGSSDIGGASATAAVMAVFLGLALVVYLRLTGRFREVAR